MPQEELKKKILSTISTALEGRDGKDDLLYYIEKGTDFFTAPSSTLFHGNSEGGLMEHSWNVYQLLKKKVSEHNLKTSAATVVICGLLHDLCKVNFYVKAKKNIKNKDTGFRWQEVDCYEVDDQFPAGHGEKSVFILQRFIKLTDEEILVIRWHMANFDPAIHFNYPSGYPYRKTIKEYQLLTLLMAADLEASNLLEKVN